MHSPTCTRRHSVDPCNAAAAARTGVCQSYRSIIADGAAPIRAQKGIPDGKLSGDADHGNKMRIRNRQRLFAGTQTCLAALAEPFDVMHLRETHNGYCMEFLCVVDVKIHDPGGMPPVARDHRHGGSGYTTSGGA